MHDQVKFELSTRRRQFFRLVSRHWDPLRTTHVVLCWFLVVEGLVNLERIIATIYKMKDARHLVCSESDGR